METVDASGGERVESDWLHNILKCVEDEGVVGLARATVAHTTSIAVSVASAATEKAFHVVSEAAGNADRFLTGHVSIKEKPNDEKCEGRDPPLVLKITSSIADIMHLAISPLLVKDAYTEKIRFENHSIVEKKMIEAESSSLSQFFDADCCDESVYYDANSLMTRTLSTDSLTSSPQTDECIEVTSKPIPSTVIVQESPIFYLDTADMMSDDDECLIPLNETEKMEPLQRVLDILVERSLSIATMDGASTGEILDWKPDNHTEKIFKQGDAEELAHFKETEVLKWTSSLPKSNCQMLKTQGIVNMTAMALNELLLDCDRVHLYNKNSVKKEDLVQLSPLVGEAKIVLNVLKIPVVGIQIDNVSLTHSRYMEDGGYIIVSQSVVSDISSKPAKLYSFSTLRSVPDSDKTELTNISLISSMPIPKFLMRRVGFMGADDFFKNIRALCCDFTKESSLSTSTEIEALRLNQENKDIYM